MKHIFFVFSLLTLSATSQAQTACDTAAWEHDASAREGTQPDQNSLRDCYFSIQNFSDRAKGVIMTGPDYNIPETVYISRKVFQVKAGFYRIRRFEQMMNLAEDGEVSDLHRKDFFSIERQNEFQCNAVSQYFKGTGNKIPLITEKFNFTETHFPSDLCSRAIKGHEEETITWLNCHSTDKQYFYSTNGC